MSEFSIVKQRDTFDVIHSATNKAVDLIRPTYGPASNKVILSTFLHGQPLVVDDGVQIARDLQFSDPAENAVLKIIRQVATTTNDRVGDGTTSSLIMLQAIINEVARMGHRDGRRIEQELKKGFEEVQRRLKNQAIEIKSLADLEKVARISFDDEAVARMIAETWHALGKDGVITLDRSSTMETYAEITEGISIDQGYISPYLVNNPSRMESVIEDPYILITDYRLTATNDLLPILNKLAEKGARRLVIIAENIEGEALAAIVKNSKAVIFDGKQGTFDVVAINAPSGDNRTVFLEDVALMTGGRVLSAQKGDKLELATISDLGRAARFIARQESSLIVSPKGKREATRKAIEDLQLALSLENNARQKEALEQRLAQFSGKIAVIKVGAPTDNEEKALRMKVEDAVNAVRAAYRGGVVCGSGLSLARLKTSSPILNEALKAPYKQLCDNMGITESIDLEKGEAQNVVTGEIGDFMKVGVLDPVDVLIAGVESAVSIASLLCTTMGMIVELPEKIKE